MNRIWKGVALAASLLLIFCAVAGCTPETNPDFGPAYIYNEYGKLVGTTECLVDGDPTSESLALVEINPNSVSKEKSSYTDLVPEYGLGMPVLADNSSACYVYTVDKVPVIKVLNWSEVCYVIPAQSEEAAWEIYGNFMQAWAESMGIGEE